MGEDETNVEQTYMHVLSCMLQKSLEFKKADQKEKSFIN